MTTGISRVCCSGALAALLVSCASVGIRGPKGNDTGGIIPWSVENERAALRIAQDNCGRHDKFAVITSVRRQYGDYIVYVCRFDPPRRRS
jgi:hypothetical protein